jgi:transglutaminase-like putative cysteine protease
MLKLLALSATIGVGGSIGALALLTARMYRRLPTPGLVAIDGIATIADAVAACRRTGLAGWELVAYAQQLVAHKFTYSRLNTWDTPARAFKRGRGYCEQQALALKAVYDALGITTRPVFAMRCAFPSKTVDGVRWPGGISGHAWLRVRIGDEERDVCPGSVENTPGCTQFQPLSPVHSWVPWLRPFTHVGSSLENIRRDLVAQWQAQKADDLRSAMVQVGGRR